jgi:hypothetical protein
MSKALMMKAARSSETLVNFYQTTRRYNPEDSHLRTQRRENLKSYLILFDLSFSIGISIYDGNGGGGSSSNSDDNN